MFSVCLFSSFLVFNSFVFSVRMVLRRYMIEDTRLFVFMLVESYQLYIIKTLFFLSFYFFKEEFRELREQPSDPQAEQELINSIEQVYFSADPFDIVKYELEVKGNFD